MSETANDGGTSDEKPVLCKIEGDDTKFPPISGFKFDFDEDISEEEKQYYKEKFKDLEEIKNMRLHCTACDRHLGCSPNAEDRMRIHPMLRTLVCHSCYTFYNSGEFEKGDDGSELYCRWCGQGGQVYCCAECPHVFCAKCIKRNMGTHKIKEIESLDDWKCFKCNFKVLWDLRAICWAVLRYCAMKRKMGNDSQDQKDVSSKNLGKDESTCCINKSKRKEKLEAKKKEAKEAKDKEIEAKVAANAISKIPPTIQVKKFASINMEPEQKKAPKRSLSPKMKPAYTLKNAIAIAPLPKMLTPVCMPPSAKKIRLPSTPVMNSPIRIINADNLRKATTTYTRIRPKPNQNNTFNGYAGNMFNNHMSNISNLSNDNINLSLDSLTQGLDMTAVAAMAQDNDVVCTPDFPLEPLCEVTEDNDDDVECITPGPVAIPRIANPPPLVPRSSNTNLNDMSSDNIVQMTENDVTVNEATGGLKFRVDPQTLSSHKMYRLPDGRIFAINVNPNMPGGYSATIVAVAESSGKTASKGVTYAAKLSAVSSATTPKRKQAAENNSKQSVAKVTKNSKSPADSSRQCDFNVPVEWYRYNLIDAIDALEYPLTRLNKLKKEATSIHLRSRTLDEMQKLHRTLDRLLNTSISRFTEIRANLNKGYKQYVSKKNNESHISDDEDDDDVEILPDLDDDPIFIDENSNDSNINGEVDLTGAGSSEHNESTENEKNISDPLNVTDNLKDSCADASNDTIIKDIEGPDKDDKNDTTCGNNEIVTQENDTKTDTDKDIEDRIESNPPENESNLNSKDLNSDKNADIIIEDGNSTTDKNIDSNPKKAEKSVLPDIEKNACESKIKSMDVTNGERNEDILRPDKTVHSILDGFVDNKGETEDNDEAMKDSEISEEMIENLLKDDSREDAATNSNSLDVAAVLGEA